MLLHHSDDCENDDPETQHDHSTGTSGIESVDYCHHLTTSPVSRQPQSCLIDCQADRGETALLYAIKDRTPVEILQEILNWKPNLKLESERDRGALHKIVCNIAGNDTGARMDILQCLLEHSNGYGPDYMFDRVRALHSAVEKEDYSLAAIEYLSNITDVKSPDIGGNTVLHLAVKRRHHATKIVSVLLRSPYAVEAVNIRNGSGKTVLHDAIIHCTDTDTVLAIAVKADVNMRDGDGKTPLHYAVQSLKDMSASC